MLKHRYVRNSSTDLTLSEENNTCPLPTVENTSSVNDSVSEKVDGIRCATKSKTLPPQNPRVSSIKKFSSENDLKYTGVKVSRLKGVGQSSRKSSSFFGLDSIESGQIQFASLQNDSNFHFTHPPDNIIINRIQAIFTVHWKLLCGFAFGLFLVVIASLGIVLCTKCSSGITITTN